MPYYELLGGTINFTWYVIMEGRFGRAEITVASMSPAAVHTVESLEEV